MALIPSAKRVIDLAGKTVIPGFVDAHTHLTVSGIKSRHVQLDKVRSIKGIQKELKQALNRYSKDQWVLGFSWDESNWKVKRYVTGKDLDEVSTEHRIGVFRVDGHLVSVNSRGLQILNVDLNQKGVEKDKKGKPTGVLKDIKELNDCFQPSPEEIHQGIIAGNQMANKLGITAAVDNIRTGHARHIREAERLNELTARMVINVPSEQIDHMIGLGLTSGMGSPMVRIGGVKSFIDGSIGASTAATSEPYTDSKYNKGMLLMSQHEFSKLAKKAVENDIQTVTHAIGDEAIELVLSAFETLGNMATIRRQRHRIEHAEMITPEQIRRAAALGLILSMQPNFVGEWQMKGGLYHDRLGKERTERMNLFRTALDNGARICFGSDGMPYGPLYGIWCAVNHPSPQGRITVEEAIRCYTMESAYASFMENNVGSLTEGKRADFVVLSDNILEAPLDSIRDIKIEWTIVGGQVEYSSVGS
jgi:predicted amidohydrolase YtcJ